MRVLLINPNSTAAMTTHVAAQLALHLSAGTDILQHTATKGATVIATQQAFDAAAQTSVDMLSQALDEGLVFDRVLLACFGDPGLEAMQLQTKTPVVGLAQASLQTLERMHKTYAVVTAGAAWEAILVRRFRQWGASDLFCGVQVINGTGLDVFNNPLAALPAVLRAIDTARATGAEQIILGGAVFAGYTNVMKENGLNTQGLLDCAACAADELIKRTP